MARLRYALLVALLTALSLSARAVAEPAPGAVAAPDQTAAPAQPTQPEAPRANAALVAPAEAAASETCPANIENAAAITCLVNVVRRAQGLRTLRWDYRLARAGAVHVEDMVARQYFSHTTPEGGMLVERVRRSGALNGSRRWWIGEALAWAWGDQAGPERLVAMWWESPAHRKLMLDRRARRIGVAVRAGAPLERPEGTAALTAALEVSRTSRGRGYRR